MNIYPIPPYSLWRAAVCLLAFLPCFLCAQYPNSGYVPLIPNTLGAADAPVGPPPSSPPPPRAVAAPVSPPPPVSPPEQPPERKAELPRGPAIPEKAEEVLDYWFGVLTGPDELPAEDKLRIWFAPSAESERQIRDYFSQDVLNAARGEYNAWRETPRGRLALILLLDQFPRRLYFGQPQSVGFDRMARSLVLEGLKKREDVRLLPIEKAFFYLPLQHAEDPDMQTLSLIYYQQLWRDAPPSLKPQLESFLKAAISRQMQIARFGRFPHRNALLGRDSTAEEEDFLKREQEERWNSNRLKN